MATKRDKHIEKIARTLQDTNPELVGTVNIAESIVNAIEALVGKPKSKSKPEGSKLWDYYVQMKKKRYPDIKPLRSAKTNAQCNQIIARIGYENSMRLVHFYIQQNDAIYTRKFHSLNMLLVDCEVLWDRFQTGQTVSTQKARRAESASNTMNSAESYLRRKHGRTDK